MREKQKQRSRLRLINGMRSLLRIGSEVLGVMELDDRYGADRASAFFNIEWAGGLLGE